MPCPQISAQVSMELRTGTEFAGVHESKLKFITRSHAFLIPTISSTLMKIMISMPSNGWACTQYIQCKSSPNLLSILKDQDSHFTDEKPESQEVV